MIDYNSAFFGIPVLFRVHGSAAYKTTLLSIISCTIYVVLNYYLPESVFGALLLSNPYPIAALVAGCIFLFSSKVNYSYNRFWEACIALHNMQSKWLDIGTTIASFHLQSDAYKAIQPPSFGQHPEANDLILERERTKDDIPQEQHMERTYSVGKAPATKIVSRFGGFLKKKAKNNGPKDASSIGLKEKSDLYSINATITCPGKIPHPRRKYFRKCYQQTPSPAGSDRTERGSSDSVCDEMKESPPSLFLQEACHLISLLSAVALSSLRYDVEGAEAPLAEFIPGKPWPSFNSDQNPNMRRYGYQRCWLVEAIRFFFDITPTDHERASYNVCRPFPVVGGISDGEAQFLQSARGPTAKVALVQFWLDEFIIREHLNGGMGNVAPPIISRLHQYQSDGFLWFNSARKMAYIPFPFPHAQITILFVLIATIFLPALMLSFTSFWTGFVLNYFTVMVFSGIHEVSKSLELPFRSMPNDLPLDFFQAQFNEALLTMFAGFHPDSWWEIKADA